jgi:O-antigen ligase
MARSRAAEYRAGCVVVGRSLRFPECNLGRRTKHRVRQSCSPVGCALDHFAATRAVTKLSERQRWHGALAFAAGAFLGANFVLIELLTDSAITNPSGFSVAMPIVISRHDSSQLALIASLLVLLLASKWRLTVVTGLASLWCACFVIVIPLDIAVYRAGLHEVSWLPSSYRARVIIWDYTAEQVIAHPLFGVGARSTRILRQEQASTVEKPEGFVFSRSLGQHAHDLFLQTWFELGAVGAILIAIAGAAVIMRIRFLPIRAQPFAAATFTAFAGIAAFAWDMWQTWWMAAVGLAALYLCLGAAATHARPPEGP